MSEREKILDSIVSHLDAVKDLAKRARADYSFVSEVDHMLKVAQYNLEEERRLCGKGN